jgi:hypothetical protein
MSKKCPQRKSGGSWKKGHKPWNEGLTKETDKRVKEVGIKIKDSAVNNSNFGNRNKHFTIDHKRKISKKQIGNINSKSAVKVSWQRILKEVPELEKQGFRVIPITSVIPDIIAIKDDKIFAVEVEYKTPNYTKYTDEVRQYFDDIIWLIRKKGDKN